MPKLNMKKTGIANTTLMIFVEKRTMRAMHQPKNTMQRVTMMPSLITRKTGAMDMSMASTTDTTLDTMMQKTNSRKTLARIIEILLCIIIFLISQVQIFAHSGRTDSNGKHYDSSTGEYHFHHGYAAHQHTDLNDDGIPDCPYDFDDKTGESSGSSSSSSQVSQDERTDSAVGASNTYSNLSGKSSESANQARESSGGDSEDARHELLILGVSFIVFFIIIPISVAAVDNHRARVFRLNSALSDLQKIHETPTNRERLKSFHRADQKRLAIELAEQLSILTEHAQKVRADFSLPGVPNIDEVSPLPKDCFIDEKGLPHTRGSIDRCTVYISSSGVYHTSRCHHAASGIPCNILNAMYGRVTHGRPCRVCKPEQNLTWYIERIESEARLKALREVLEYVESILSRQIPEPAKAGNESLIIQNSCNNVAGVSNQQAENLTPPDDVVANSFRKAEITDTHITTLEEAEAVQRRFKDDLERQDNSANSTGCSIFVLLGLGAVAFVIWIITWIVHQFR